MSWRGKRMLPPVACALILTCCATTDTGAIDAAALERICPAWPYVTWSARDTPETVIDAKVNNAAKGAFCEGLDPNDAGRMDRRSPTL